MGTRAEHEPAPGNSREINKHTYIILEVETAMERMVLLLRSFLARFFFISLLSHVRMAKLGREKHSGSRWGEETCEFFERRSWGFFGV